MELEVRVFGVWFFMTLGRFEEVSQLRDGPNTVDAETGRERMTLTEEEKENWQCQSK